jgi:hypothetical protein
LRRRYCSSASTRVVDSRLSELGDTVRRPNGSRDSRAADAIMPAVPLNHMALTVTERELSAAF